LLLQFWVFSSYALTKVVGVFVRFRALVYTIDETTLRLLSLSWITVWVRRLRCGARPGDRIPQAQVRNALRISTAMLRRHRRRAEQRQNWSEHVTLIFIVNNAKSLLLSAGIKVCLWCLTRCLIVQMTMQPKNTSAWLWMLVWSGVWVLADAAPYLEIYL
jgi:hypothetical protein